MRARVRGELSKNGDGERIGNLDILRRLQRDIGDGESAGPLVIIVCGIRDDARCCSPVDCGKFEWDNSLEITAIGALAVLIQSVVAREVCVPLKAREVG